MRTFFTYAQRNADSLMGDIAGAAGLFAMLFGVLYALP